jgi:hypothetical protein
VIELPNLIDGAGEDEWIAEIEARFERHAFDPFEAGPPRGAEADWPA